MKRSAPYTDDELAKALDALSNPVRLAILRALEEPRCLSQIGISPSGSARASGRGEILARQTVKQHLDRLAGAGIVVANKVSRKKGETTEYVLNPHALAGIAEAFQQLAQVFAKADLVTETRIPSPLAFAG